MNEWMNEWINFINVSIKYMYLAEGKPSANRGHLSVTKNLKLYNV